MRLILKRSQRDGGIVSKSVIFCLDARVEFTAAEKANLTRYKLYKQVIYNSEATQKHLQKAAMSAATGNALGSVKALGSLAFAAMNLSITIRTLEDGQHVECKTMEELLGAEDAVKAACQNLKLYLDTAATFDGTAVLIEFADEGPVIVASTAVPEQKLIASPQPQHAPRPEAITAEYTPAPPLEPPPPPTPGAPASTYQLNPLERAIGSFFGEYSWDNNNHRAVTIVGAIAGFIFLAYFFR